MKYISPVFALFFFAICTILSAQPTGYVEVRPLSEKPVSRTGCFGPESGVYDAEKLRKVLLDKDCSGPGDLDLENQTLIGYSVGGDCHMSVRTKVMRSAAEKKYKVIVNNIDGGCRAGGWRRGWIVIEKIEPGYSVDIVEVAVPRSYRNPPDEFIYPKPPSTITREQVQVREVDMAGCLTLTGQSQWVLGTREHLDKALERDPDRIRCTEHLKGLNIDLEREALIGYSFSSGHCTAPVFGLEAIRETSTDRTENRLVLNVSYERVGGEYCKVWTTHSVWMVVDKPPTGYGYDLRNAPRDRK